MIKIMKQIGIWAGVIAIIIGTIWGLIALVNSNNPASNSQAITPPPLSKEDIVLGIPESAKATLIEYADFQCPACRNYAPLVRQLGKDFGNKLLLVYRFFPLTDIHQNAMSSSLAAYAASKQNKFWEMNDLLYENQSTWADSGKAQEIFTDYAKKLDLSISQFTSDFNSETGRNFINAEQNAGLSIGINSTPTFFVNGQKIENPQNYAAFSKLIQDAINKK